jgi:hypothetical protein
MSQPFVSSYDQAFMDAFDKGIDQMPDKLPDLVKTLLDKVHEDVLDPLRNFIADEMKSILNAEIRDQAARVASSMLANALAGDSKEIRNLFGFSNWYMKHLYLGKYPTQWALIDAIVARRPDLFVDERIAQRDAEILNLNQEVTRLKQRLDYMAENYVVRDTYGEQP